MTSAPERVTIGYVVRAKGLAGEVRVEPLTENIERFDGIREVSLERGREPARTLVIESWRVDSPGILIKFAGIDTPEQAKAVLAKGYLTVPGDAVPPPPDGTHYVFDLVGCQVVDERDQVLGEIADVLAMPSADVYLVRSGGKEVMVPAVANFITDISVAERRVSVRGVEELFQ